jgi:hypothetical protein
MRSIYVARIVRKSLYRHHIGRRCIAGATWNPFLDKQLYRIPTLSPRQNRHFEGYHLLSFVVQYLGHP